LATLVPTVAKVTGHEQVGAETTDQKVRGSKRPPVHYLREVDRRLRRRPKV
jgi:hypothetical protein